MTPKRGVVEQNYFTGSIPLLTPNHSMTPKRGVVEQNYFTGSIPLLTPNHSMTLKRGIVEQKYFTGRIPLLTPNNNLTPKRGFVEQMYFTGSIPLLALACTQSQFDSKLRLCGTKMLYWEHTIAYTQSQFDTKEGFVEQMYFTGSTPLLALACTQSQFDSKLRLCGTKMLYWEHTIAYTQSQFDTKEGFVEQMYFTGSTPLLAPNHSFMTCSGKTRSGVQKCYILGTH